MLNILDYVRWWNKRYILENSDADLTTLITICKFFEKSDDYGCAEKERGLKNISKKRINEIESLKEEVKSNRINYLTVKKFLNY